MGVASCARPLGELVDVRATSARAPVASIKTGRGNTGQPPTQYGQKGPCSACTKVSHSGAAAVSPAGVTRTRGDRIERSKPDPCDPAYPLQIVRCPRPVGAECAWLGDRHLQFHALTAMVFYRAVD